MIAEIAAALGQIPSGLFILTVRHGDQETGMLASWVMQAGFEPPMVSVALNRARYVGEWLAGGAPFAIHVLAASHKKYLSHFGRGFAEGEPAFAGLPVERDAAGVPDLVEALGRLECRVRGELPGGDHRLFLAEVVGGRRNVAVEEPFIHIRSNGMRY